MIITASYIRKLIADRALTTASAAEALGISERSMQRYVTDGPGWREPPHPTVLALRALQKRKGPHERPSSLSPESD